MNAANIHRVDWLQSMAASVSVFCPRFCAVLIVF